MAPEPRLRAPASVVGEGARGGWGVGQVENEEGVRAGMGQQVVSCGARTGFHRCGQMLPTGCVRCPGCLWGFLSYSICRGGMGWAGDEDGVWVGTGVQEVTAGATGGTEGQHPMVKAGGGEGGFVPPLPRPMARAGDVTEGLGVVGPGARGAMVQVEEGDGVQAEMVVVQGVVHGVAGGIAFIHQGAAGGAALITRPQRSPS